MPKPSWSSAAQGGLGGAAAGYTIGGPYGAAAGGGLGMLAGLFGGGQEGGQDAGVKQIQKLLKQGLVDGTGPYADMLRGISKEQFAEMFPGLTGEFNQEQFNAGVADPAIKNFRERILPMLQERFIGGNQAFGSGMLREQARAGSTLQSELARLMYDAQQQHAQNQVQGAQIYSNMNQQANQNRLAASNAYIGNQPMQQGVPSYGQQIADQALPFAANAFMKRYAPNVQVG